MPHHIKQALKKMSRDFIWSNDSSPRIKMDTLHCLIDKGGLGLLDINARNEAIEIMWLKAYLNLTTSCPKWAKVTDIIIDTIAPLSSNKQVRLNLFLQAWDIPTRGPWFKCVNKDIRRMLTTAKKYHANLTAIRLSQHLCKQLPAWYHIASEPCPPTNAASKCLLTKHNTKTVADLMIVLARLWRTQQGPPHVPLHHYLCHDCRLDRQQGCCNPHACTQEALTRINQIADKLNPLSLGDRHDNLSLTRQRKARNREAA
jgi:hypothetical protein